jgi:hypothetical protein
MEETQKQNPASYRRGRIEISSHTQADPAADLVGRPACHISLVVIVVLLCGDQGRDLQLHCKVRLDSLEHVLRHQLVHIRCHVKILPRTPYSKSLSACSP